jgi:hypothetical protein
MADVVEPIAQALAIRFALHNSSFWGGDYYRGRVSSQTVAYLFHNHDLLDDTPFYEEASDCPLLLRLDHLDEQTEVLAQRIGEALALNCRVLNVWPA